MSAVLPVTWWVFWLAVGFAGFAAAAWLVIRIASVLDARDSAEAADGG